MVQLSAFFLLRLQAQDTFKSMLAHGKFERGYTNNPACLLAPSPSPQLSSPASASSPLPGWKRQYFEEYWGQKWASEARAAAAAAAALPPPPRMHFVDTPEDIARRAQRQRETPAAAATPSPT